MELVQIPIKELDKVWGMVEKNQKKTNDKYFGVVVTEIIKRKHGKVCHVYIVTGRQMSKWQHLISRVEEFAKDEGCKMMELIARPGWQKVYNNHGYKRTHVVLEKQIKQEDKDVK